MGRYDELFRRAQADGFGLEFDGPRSEEQIAQVARALGVELPPSYVAFLREYGGGGLVGAWFSGIDETDPLRTGRGLIYGDTVFCREEFGIPAELVVIQYDDEGVLCLDTGSRDGSGECPVVAFDPGRPEVVERVAGSFDEYMRAYLGAAGGTG